MNKKEKFLLAIGEVDEKYVEEARDKRMKTKPILITVAASIAIVGIVGVSMLFSGKIGSGYGNTADNTNDNNVDNVIGDTTDNTVNDVENNYGAGENYSKLTALFNGFDNSVWSYSNDLPEDLDLTDGPGGNTGSGSNGIQISISQNQVENVEEADIVKMTDKYIFKIGGVKNGGEALRIYTVNGENSEQICEYPIPLFNGSKYAVGAEMFLSQDGRTVTIIKDYDHKDFDVPGYETGILTLDVSDPENPKEINSINLSGMCIFARMVNGRLLIGPGFLVTSTPFDWSNPENYLPYYINDENKTYLPPEDVICPENIYSRTYTGVTLLTDDLDIISSKAIVGIQGISYISNDKIIVTSGYGKRISETIDNNPVCKTDMAVLSISDNGLTMEHVLTVEGWVADRFFIDEKDGYLRIVTNDYRYRDKYSFDSKNASLYIYNLKTGEIENSVLNFAPDGEQATSVRFEDNKLYVCTAVIKTYLDPVFFFDLSSYNNITYVNTGFIDGFSSTLISYGNGYLLGIGPKDQNTNKVSVYKRQGDDVITVAEYSFKGVYSNDRKAFLIDIERGLFGFVSSGYYVDENKYVTGAYNLLKLDGDSLNEVMRIECAHNATSLRSVIYGDYLYIVKNTALEVEPVNIK